MEAVLSSTWLILVVQNKVTKGLTVPTESVYTLPDHNAEFRCDEPNNCESLALEPAIFKATEAETTNHPWSTNRTYMPYELAMFK